MQAPSMVERGVWGPGDDRRMLHALVACGAAQAPVGRVMLANAAMAKHLIFMTNSDFDTFKIPAALQSKVTCE